VVNTHELMLPAWCAVGNRLLAYLPARFELFTNYFAP
jgi:hypothetical protein